MQNIKKVFYLFLFYLLYSSEAAAHVKYFVDTEKVIQESHGFTPFYSFDSMEVLIWAGVVVVMVLIFGFLDSIIKTPKKLSEFSFKHEKKIDRMVQIVLGLFLLVTVNFFWDTIITPSVAVGNTLRYGIQILQVLLGVMFILNLYPRIASVFLIILCLGLGVWSGPVVFFENLILFVVAIYFFIKNSPEDSKIFNLNKHALEIVRVGTGLSLIVAAFSEKLAYPELALRFLELHHWNFMQPFFTQFTNELFILSVGISEVIFGILFIMGYLTRITTLLLAGFLITSATTMFLTIGDWEPGHVVIYAAALLFVAFGHGKTKFFHFTWKNLKNN